MKFRFMPLFLLPTFIACGQPRPATTNTATAKSSASGKLDDGGNFRPVGQHITTQAGAEFSLFANDGARTDNGTDGWTNHAQLSISYYDEQGFFGAAPTIQVWAQLTVYSETESGEWSPDRTIVFNTAPLTRGSEGDYSGIVDFDLGGDSGSAEVMVFGDFAFNLGAVWDSNDSANYHQGELNVF